METYSYLLNTLSIIPLIFGTILISARGPKGHIYKYYRISRTLIALTYFLYGAQISVITHYKLRITNPELDAVILLSGYLISGHLLSYAYNILINNDYIQIKGIKYKSIRTSLFIIVSILSFYILEGIAIKLILIFLSLYYLAEIVNLLVVFLRLYLPIKREYDNNTSEENDAYVRWAAPSALSLFVLAFLGGVQVILLLIDNSIGVFILFFIILSILIFIYVYIEFYNYGMNLPVLLNTSKPKGESISYARLKTMIADWIDNKGWLENGLTTDILASRLGSNRKYITKYFSEEQGGSFRSFINNKRIEESKTLLSTTDLSIDEIASQIGYSSRNQFATIFKASEEVSPTQWRDIIKNET